MRPYKRHSRVQQRQHGRGGRTCGGGHWIVLFVFLFVPLLLLLLVVLLLLLLFFVFVAPNNDFKPIAVQVTQVQGLFGNHQPPQCDGA